MNHIDAHHNAAIKLASTKAATSLIKKQHVGFAATHTYALSEEKPITLISNAGPATILMVRRKTNQCQNQMILNSPKQVNLPQPLPSSDPPTPVKWDKLNSWLKGYDKRK